MNDETVETELAKVHDYFNWNKISVNGFDNPALSCRGKIPRARGMAAYLQYGYRAFRQSKFE